MYPLSKVLCPPLRKLGVTPNQITLFNILVGLGSGYGVGESDQLRISRVSPLFL